MQKVKDFTNYILPDQQEIYLLLPANEVCEGYVLHVSVILSTGGGIPACIAGGIPACLAAGLGGVVSQHSLQVSKPTPRGKFRGIWPGGSPSPHPRGSWGGSSQGGLQTHTGGESALLGESAPGGGGVPGFGDAYRAQVLKKPLQIVITNRGIFATVLIFHNSLSTYFVYLGFCSCRKVMFLHLSVILFMEGGAVWQGACVAGDMCGRDASQRGVCMAVGYAWWGHVWLRRGDVCMVGEMATAADGTHPTRMHSCSFLWRLRFPKIESN